MIVFAQSLKNNRARIPQSDADESDWVACGISDGECQYRDAQEYWDHEKQASDYITGVTSQRSMPARLGNAGALLYFDSSGDLDFGER